MTTKERHLGVTIVMPGLLEAVDIQDFAWALGRHFRNDGTSVEKKRYAELDGVTAVLMNTRSVHHDRRGNMFVIITELEHRVTTCQLWPVERCDCPFGQCDCP